MAVPGQWDAAIGKYFFYGSSSKIAWARQQSIKNQASDSSRTKYHLKPGDLLFVSSKIEQGDGVWLEVHYYHRDSQDLDSGFLYSPYLLGVSGLNCLQRLRRFPLQVIEGSKRFLVFMEMQPSDMHMPITMEMHRALLRATTRMQFITTIMRIVHEDRSRLVAKLATYSQTSAPTCSPAEVAKYRRQIADYQVVIEALTTEHCLQLVAENTSQRMRPVHRELKKNFRLFNRAAEL